MPERLYVGFDLGTTAIKVGLFDGAGGTVATASREIRLDTPSPGFVEFDAEAYLQRAFECVREVCGSVDADAVEAIGVSSQAQTFVVVGEGGRPLRPAVSWLDVRAKAEADELSAQSVRLGFEEVDAISSAPKLLWLRRHEGECFQRVRRVLLIPDYLIYRLTGRAVSDVVFAASTGAYDRWGRRWIEPLLAACGLDVGVMPEVKFPGEPVGRLTAEAARALGLSEDVLVAVGTNDQPAGALGAGNVFPGCASLALGTALAFVATSDRREGVPEGVGVMPHPASDRTGGEGALYALLAFAKTAGIVIRWFRDNFAPGESYEDLFREVASVPIGAEGLSCLPHFSGTATPDFNPSVRGAFSGLTLAHGRAHLARALAESLAFTVRENLELLNRAVRIGEVRAIGGGARSDVWLQMIADVTGVPVQRPQTSEAACLGAAALGMVGAGRFTSVAQAARALYRPGRRFEPDTEVRAQYAEAFTRYRALYEALYGGKRTDA